MSNPKPVDWRQPFLAALAEIPVVKHAAQVAGISTHHAQFTRRNDPVFAAAWAQALEDGIDKAERELFRRAVEGFEEPVVHQGQMSFVIERDSNGQPIYDTIEEPYIDSEGVQKARKRVVARLARDAQGLPIPLTVRKHSDALLALLMRGRRKHLYSERTEITGADGKPLNEVDETTKAARVAQLMAIAKTRAEAAKQATLDEQQFGDLA